MKIPETKKQILDEIVNDLKKVDNLVAVVLGGSHCIGTANENSDLDIGIYYYEVSPFDIEQVKLIAGKYNVDDTMTVTGFYQWGAWVNGGAWLNTASGEVDILYRNIDQVRATIEKSVNGIWENDFEQQPPFGFSSVIYLAKTNYCYPLYDPYHVIKEMKEEVRHYPLKLKQTIIQQSLWAAEFALWQAEKFARKGDIHNTVGCFTRILKNITDALFALNELYSLGDKSAFLKIVQMPKCPDNFKEQVEAILSINSHTLTGNAGKLRNLFSQVTALAGGMYQPYFQL
ncbi:MAG: nucleotidyltransferase domain-containing protein [Bacteroidota bacterium]